jgi:hypothetical protein
MVYCNSRRSRRVLSTLPFSLNCLLIALGVFILLAMSVVLIIFEEFTAFTDYTQQWIEFNFFIYYWDKLTITRVYLSFIFIYGAVIIAVPSLQIYGLRKKDLNFLHLAPLILIAVSIITVLGAMCWLIVTAVNYNEGFLATGGFIFERMRFKGNVWKDLIYREESFRIVTENRVPIKAPIIKIWVHQRERDFSCCGWNSYEDYKIGNYTDLPESCCQRSHRVYGCANDFQTLDRSSIVNTRGCRATMYSWYRSGFAENIVMSIIGVIIAAFEFYLYSLNRKEYFKLLDELDDMRKPMMNATMSMSTIHSKNGSCAGPPCRDGGTIGCNKLNSGHTINFGPTPTYNPRSFEEPPSITGSTSGLISNNHNQQPFMNPLQTVQNLSGKFNAPKRFQPSQNSNSNSNPINNDKNNRENSYQQNFGPNDNPEYEEFNQQDDDFDNQRNINQQNYDQ